MPLPYNCSAIAIRGIQFFFSFLRYLANNSASSLIKVYRVLSFKGILNKAINISRAICPFSFWMLLGG